MLLAGRRRPEASDMIIGITTTYVEEEQKDEIVPVERVRVE